MLVVATTDASVEAVLAGLGPLGPDGSTVVDPGGRRRLVIADIVDEARAHSLAAALRDAGEAAVVRPDRGVALDAWRRATRPLVIDGRVSVCPVWSEHERRGLPGLVELGFGGFGNGHHPTTRLMLDELVKRVGGGERVLDVGCGSGVLALASLTSGAGRSVGVDLKAEAVEAARRNAALNGLADRMQATTDPLDRLANDFDIVVANIARAGIVALADQLVDRLAPGGWLAVSGISPGQITQVGGFLRPLVEVDRRVSGDWALLVVAQP